MELCSPAPFTLQAFIDFNREYCTVLKAWGLYVEELNPVARTNVAPACDPPAVPSLYAFSYVVPNDQIDRKTLIVAGRWRVAGGAPCDRGDYPARRHFARCHAREGRL